MMMKDAMSDGRLVELLRRLAQLLGRSMPQTSVEVRGSNYSPKTSEEFKVFLLSVSFTFQFFERLRDRRIAQWMDWR